MKTNAAGIALIKKFESFSPVKYICPAGLPTIGYGHVILPHEHFDRITQAQGEELLKKDLLPRECGVFEALTVDLTSNQFSACVSLAYNIGVGAFRESTLVKCINAKDFDRAASEFLRWDKCHGRPLKGLTLRRMAEKRLFETGEVSE